MAQAVVVGETSAGAGHQVAPASIGNGFVASISFARVTDARTGKEWERVGVTPDIAVPAAAALERVRAELAAR